MARYFKITGANAADIAQIAVMMRSKTFYPEATSTPALPASYDPAFDYRQFFIVIGFDKDGYAIVYTRKDYTVNEFNTNVIPTADWTGRYYLSIAPTVAITPYSELDAAGHSYKTRLDSFLSWDYQLHNNK